MARPFQKILTFLPRLGSNWITLFGTVVVSIAGVTILAALAIDLTSEGLNSYAATVLFLLLPGVLALGLLLIPIGLLVERRRAKAAPAAQDAGESALGTLTQALR